MTNLQEKRNFDVPGFEGLQINKLGTVLRGDNYNSSYFIANVFISKHGYKKVCYKRKSVFLHRLLALTFIPNPENKPFINHINGNKLDNRLENLEWVTVTENNRHSYHVLDSNSQYPKRKVEIYKEGIFITECISVREAAKFVKGASTNVSKCCQGKRKTHNGYTFKYADNVSKIVKPATKPRLSHKNIYN